MVRPPKQVLREASLAARRSLSAAERSSRSHLIAERAIALQAFARARTVALYVAMGAEVDPADIARAALRDGKVLAYPRTDERQRRLTFATCSAGEFVDGAYRSREPPSTAADIPLSAIDLIVVPGVAFDPRCRRLGRGRGHYDATLGSLSPAAVRVGLGFEVQLVPEVPQEPHDVPLDVVVTESRVLSRLRDIPAGPSSSR